MINKIKSIFYEIIAQYHYTKGCKSKSIEWLIRASEIGSELAQDRLGERYFKGDGVTKNLTLAHKYWTLAAKQNSIYGNANLAWLYYSGLSGEQDYKKAISHYEIAAAGGHPDSQYNLGLMYADAIGTEKDKEKARILFENASKQGVGEAADALNRMINPNN